MNNNEDKKETPPSKNTVEILKPKYNLLKNKAGTRTNMKDNGFIEESKIQATEILIAHLCESSKETLKEQISILTALWEGILKTQDDDKRKEKTKRIYTIAHEIRDISALCRYGLITDFAESLRDYIGEATLNMKNQRIIIQAHIDALSTVLKHNISDANHPVAEELKKKVKIAIEKYR